MNHASIRRIRIMAKSVLLEALRRREFPVVMIFTAVFLLGIVAARAVGITNPETATFILNLGMTLAIGAAHLLTILTAARQIPADLENRTIHPILARPVTRAEYLLGKWAACFAAGTGTLLLLVFIAWVAAPKMEDYSSVMLCQAIVAGVLSIAAAAAMTLLLTLALPHAVSVVVAILIVWFGRHAIGFLVVHAGLGTAGGIARWIAEYMPDFAKMNLVTRYTDGTGPLDPASFAGLTIYAILIISACHAAAVLLFERRRL